MLLCCLLGAAVLVGLDQWVKLWAFRDLQQIEEIRLIPGVLHLMYRENFGAAFSILQNQRFFLVTVTAVVLLVLLALLLMRRIRQTPQVIALSLVLSGGAGNLIDRAVRGFVVDYIYFVPINFPVFNLADCCVVIGTGLILLDVLVLDLLRQRRKGAQEEKEQDNG